MGKSNMKESLLQKKKKLEKAIQPLLELQEELREVDLLIAALEMSERQPECGGPGDR